MMRFKDLVEKMKVSQDRDVDELPGTQPSKYYKGVDKDEKEKRAKQFARQAKMDDDDPRAYKPAPGDKDTKTKPSKHTNKFKQMYGERALTPAEKDKMKEYEKKIDKKDFIDRYGEEEGERVYYATITKMAKKNEAVSPAQQAAIAISKKERGEKPKNEDAPRWLKDIIGNKLHKKEYDQAQKILQDVIARKKKEAGRKGLQHDIGYYAAQIARQFRHVDAKNLAKLVNEEDPCWDNYKQVGMKKKNGKMVPNCVQESRAKKAVAGNKVQKLVTGFDMTYKGKKYDEIDFELMGIDNSTQVVTFRILHPKEHIGDEVKIPFKTLRRGRFMATDTSKINEEVSQKQINDLEKFADRILAKFDIDVEFTRHFVDRMNDKRNTPEIKVAELQKLFKKIQKNKAKNIKGSAGLEAVLKDLSSDLNLPVVIKQKGNEIELVNKTIMRKPDFKTTSKIIKYEEFSKMDEASRADMKVRKRPHMMLKAGNAGVKFDGRFKMYKKKQVLQDEEKPLEESFEDLTIEVFDLMESTENAITEDSGEALKKKAEKTGMPLSILKKVFDRGVAAWRTGHRPGTTATQWGLARVNSFTTKSKGTWGGADQDLAKKVRNEEMNENVLQEKFSPKEIKMAIGVASDKRYAGGNMTGAARAIEKIKKGLSSHPQVAAVLKRQNEMNEGKSSTGYELYHKDFSSAMQHAYKHAKDKLKIEIDPEEIDNKVATGPRKPSKGKTNTYRLTDKSGKKAVHIQVANLDNKKYELNMYKEDVDHIFEELFEEVLMENAKIKKAVDKAHKFFVKTSKGKSERIQEKNRFAALEMLKKELEKSGASETDMMKAFGDLDQRIMKVMDESVELEENMSRVAKELEAYARKSGGIDKMDFMKAAMMMKKGQTSQLKKFVDDLDTEPREKILSLMGKDADRRKDYKAHQKKMREEVELEEGINDPGIFKAVFLAGGPGSGKSFMVGKTALTTLGLKLINSDPAFEAQLKKVGLSPTPEDIFTDKGQAARAKAKRLTAKQQELALNGRLGLVIDGTGKDYDKIAKQANDLKKLGYEVAMIFVNTNLETAIARDAARDRTLGAKEVTKMWNEVQDNIGKFQRLFGNMMVVVDNSNGSDWKTASTQAYKKMSKWVAATPKSPMAKKWIASQKAKRGITEEDMQMMESKSKVLEYGTDETTNTYKNVTPGEKIAQRIKENILRNKGRKS